MMVDTDTFSRTVLERFITDPDKSKLLKNENFKKFITNYKEQLDDKLETRKILKRVLRPRGANESIEDYRKYINGEN